MKLRIKISLVVLPVVAAAIIFLGLWTIRSTDRFFADLMFGVLAKDLEVYVGTTLKEISSRAYEQAGSQVMLRAQQEAFSEARQEYTLETGHIVIISVSGEALLCSRDYGHHQTANLWQPLVALLVEYKLLPAQGHEPHQEARSHGHDNSLLQGSRATVFEVSQEIRQGDIPMLQGHATINGDDALYVATYFKPWNWVVVSTISKQEINNTIAGLRQATLLVAVATIVVTFVLTCMAMRRFVIRPISRLQEAAMVITGQGHVEKVAVDSDDELGSLARSMEVLSFAQQRYQEYQAASQEQLEKMVAERTSALQSSNDALNNEISERIEANKKYERLLYTLDQTLDSVFMFRPDDLRFSYVNKGGMQLVGYSYDELRGMTPMEIGDPELDEARFRKQLAPLVRGEEKFLSFETIQQHKDGHQIPVEIFLQYVAQEEKDSLFIAIVRDISARKRAEVEKRELERKLLQAHKMEAVGTLAGGIAHDFNNILASIIGFAELAQEQVAATSPVRSDLDQVLQAGRRAKELVKQILAFSRQNNDEKFLIYPQHIIKETVQILRATVPSRVEITAEISEQCPMILADPTQIHQVLLNLCVNGVYAMAEKGRLAIALHEVELAADEVAHHPGLEAGRFICLSVSDSGPGIQDTIIKKIFDPFFTTKAVGEGTGMGLAMVHGIVEDHGGMVRVKSSLGQGTTFEVFLPASSAKEEGQGDEAPGTQAPAPALTGVGHILVVDDEAAIVGLYKRSLAARGYTVTTAQDGQAALDIFRSKPDSFDMLITDQTMPRMTGTELVKEVLAIRSDLPVILCSGYSSSIDAAQIHELGVRRYLYKPMDLMLLAKDVREILATQGDKGKA